MYRQLTVFGYRRIANNDRNGLNIPIRFYNSFNMLQHDFRFMNEFITLHVNVIGFFDAPGFAYFVRVTLQTHEMFQVRQNVSTCVADVFQLRAGLKT